MFSYKFRADGLPEVKNNKKDNMRKFYFFKTSMEVRGGVNKNTLRALPGQFFDDGVAVSTTFNVQSPKTPDATTTGTREEYPIGTIFASPFLAETESANGVFFYTIYDNQKCEFYPVDTGNGFQYISESHRNDEANKAYALFEAGLADDEDNNSKEKTVAIAYPPADSNGIASKPNPNWKEAYVEQVEREAQMFRKWILRIFASKNVKLPGVISMKELTSQMEELYRCGESLDSLANAKRVDNIFNKVDVVYDDFSLLKKTNPAKEYFKEILSEHKKGLKCSALEREVNNQSIEDVGDFISSAFEAVTGSVDRINSRDSKLLSDAMNEGWTLDQLLKPDNIVLANDIHDYISKIAKKEIELPVMVSGLGVSYIDTIMSEKKNKKPSIKSGFYITDETWKILIRNVHRRENTMILGPAGSGKTEVVSRIAKQLGLPLTVIQMGAITDVTAQLVGKMDKVKGEMEFAFDWAPFALAIQKPGIILLDELNRIPSDGGNALFSCLDKTRELAAPDAKSTDKRIIKVHPDCVFFATCNIGIEYTGTKEIDKAIEDRFFFVEMDYLPVNIEANVLCERTGLNKDDALNIATVASKLRLQAQKGELSTAITTRDTLRCAELVKDGFDIVQAFEYAVLPKFDKGDDQASSERAVVKTVIQQRLSNSKQ